MTYFFVLALGVCFDSGLELPNRGVPEVLMDETDMAAASGLGKSPDFYASATPPRAHPRRPNTPPTGRPTLGHRG